MKIYYAHFFDRSWTWTTARTATEARAKIKALFPGEKFWIVEEGSTPSKG